MEKILAKAPLFQGIPEGERVGLLERLGAEVRRFPKAGAVCRNGDPAVLGVVLSGGLTVENVDVWGNKTILDHIAPGQVFGEAFACAGEPMGVSVTAAEESEVLLLRGEGLLEARGCPGHERLLRNLLVISARENLRLSRRSFHTAAKTIRGRLLSYLSDQAVAQGGREVVIPFDRQQLADYLGVDRSAMSHELSRMREDGLLTYRKNRFVLNETLEG